MTNLHRKLIVLGLVIAILVGISVVLYQAQAQSANIVTSAIWRRVGNTLVPVPDSLTIGTASSVVGKTSAPLLDSVKLEAHGTVVITEAEDAEPNDPVTLAFADKNLDFSAGLIYATSSHILSFSSLLDPTEPSNMIINGHLGFGYNDATSTSIATSTGAGSTGTASIDGNDTNGTITVVAGTSPSSSAVVATTTFAWAYTSAPTVILSPANAVTAQLYGTSTVWANSSTTNFTLNSGSGALVNATTYKWYYQVLGL